MIELHKNFFTISTPGHTAGSYSFVYKIGEQTLLFSGDTLFIGMNNKIDITKMYSSNVILMRNSIKKLQNSFSPNYLFPSGSLGSIHYLELKGEDWNNQLKKVI